MDLKGSYNNREEKEENVIKKQLESEDPSLKIGRILIGSLVSFVGLLFIGDCHELYQWAVVIMIIIGGVFLLFYKGT